MSRPHTVLINDKRRSIRFQRESLDLDEGFQLRAHFSEEFVRFQEFSNDAWTSKYYYILFNVLVANDNDVFPMLMHVALRLSGGTFLFLLVTCSVLLGLPLVYMEAFLGRYTRLSNCQMYRMASLFFGVCIVIFVMNVFYQPGHAVKDTELLVNMLKLLVNPDMNTECLDEKGYCYDYKKRGPLNDTCKYNYFSMVCKKHGEIRYPMEYRYCEAGVVQILAASVGLTACFPEIIVWPRGCTWKMYKDPTSTVFPYYQIITGVVITWGVVLCIIMKGIQALGSIVHAAFLMQIGILTVIFLLALGRDGSTRGLELMVSVDLSGIDAYQILIVFCYSFWRLGFVIPTGYMTFSAYAKFESNLGTECFLIVALSIALGVYYLMGFCLVCGALSHGMQVNPESVFVHDSGLYLALVPEFLVYMQLPNIFAILYYTFLWFFEVAKIALCVHMLALNLFDYFPTTKNFAVYIWVTSCILLCSLSIPYCSQYMGTTLAPMMLVIHVQVFLMAIVMLEATMVAYIYGIDRLCDDIHFMTGRKPITFFRVMWYIIPVVGWTSLLVIWNKYGAGGLIESSFINSINQEEWLYAAISYWGLIVLGVLATIMYVIFRFGTPNLLLTLLKPQYFWGPPDVEARIDRKNFSPQTTIRSQLTNTKTRETQYSDTLNNQLILQFSRSVLREHQTRGGVASEKTFFPSIGIYSDIERREDHDAYTQEMQRDVDISDTK